VVELLKSRDNVLDSSIKTLMINIRGCEGVSAETGAALEAQHRGSWSADAPLENTMTRWDSADTDS